MKGNNNKNKKLTKRQKLAIKFEIHLGENEEELGEGAAFALTCEQFGLTHEEGNDLLFELTAVEDYQVEGFDYSKL